MARRCSAVSDAMCMRGTRSIHDAVLQYAYVMRELGSYIAVG